MKRSAVVLILFALILSSCSRAGDEVSGCGVFFGIVGALLLGFIVFWILSEMSEGSRQKAYWVLGIGGFAGILWAGWYFGGSEQRALKAAREQEAARETAAREEQEMLRQEADSNFGAAVRNLEDGDPTTAALLLEKVARGRPDYPGLKEKVDEVQAAKEKQEEEMRELEARALAESRLQARKNLEVNLREVYLDKGFDIKVDVSGRDANRLKLTYPLFNDVFSHRFQKEGTIDTWCAMGFRRIDMTDGYDWHVYWNCN